ncbi:MAG TPA: DUF4169 family protein [Novosphingobium sp.]|jgi:hypothetical protein|nr:MAG: DUF4169 family protein [Gammaproteobacteria bacterium]HPB22171.1 DUF4169 family protein [Novosphingobium sp.]HQN53174.1 DUF4169 family protein [Novosphingobium sp.]HQQ07867.1 DUF4169 family protein [Novosphingobium sp.]
MAEVINLRLARKAKARASAARAADENRARHGLTKAVRARQSSEAERAAKLIDGARRETD